MSEADLEPIDENLAPTEERPGWAKSLGLEKASEEPKVEVPEGEEPPPAVTKNEPMVVAPKDEKEPELLLPADEEDESVETVQAKLDKERDERLRERRGLLGDLQRERDSKTALSQRMAALESRFPDAEPEVVRRKVQWDDDGSAYTEEPAQKEAPHSHEPGPQVDPRVQAYHQSVTEMEQSVITSKGEAGQRAIETANRFYEELGQEAQAAGVQSETVDGYLHQINKHGIFKKMAERYPEIEDPAGLIRAGLDIVRGEGLWSGKQALENLADGFGSGGGSDDPLPSPVAARPATQASGRKRLSEEGRDERELNALESKFHSNPIKMLHKHEERARMKKLQEKLGRGR